MSIDEEYIHDWRLCHCQACVIVQDEYAKEMAE